MAKGRGLGGSIRLGDHRLPTVVAVLMGVTLTLSIVGAAWLRSLWGLVALSPEAVWNGELWRLVTWPFVETDPVGLMINLFVLFWLGRDLVGQWGATRFLGVFLGLAALSGGLTVLIGRFLWEQAFHSPALGAWAVTDGLLIAWALYNPARQINLYFVIPVTGRVLLWVTLGGTLLYALYFGFATFLPHFLCEGIMLVYLGQARRWFLSLKLSRLQKQKRRYVNNVIRLDREEQRREKSSKPPKYLN